MSHSGREESGSESITECQESRSSRKRKAYSIDKKLEAIDYAKQYSKNSAAKKFNVGRTLIIDWVKKEKELRESQKGSKRLAEAGRHLSFAELDEELARCVREQRAAKKNVSRRIIQQQAVKTFVPEDNEKKFKACGIINAIDGSEDGEIHCFKPDGAVPSGRVKLQQACADKELADLLKEIDLEQEKENLEYDSDISLEC